MNSVMESATTTLGGVEVCVSDAPCRMTNHFSRDSPRTNAYQQIMMVSGDLRIGLYALRDISAGEEILYCYNMHIAGAAAPSWAKAPAKLRRRAS